MEYLLFTEQEILELVDEYQLYCFYLQIELILGTNYPTPDIIRINRGLPIDRTPSISVYVPTRKSSIPTYTEFMFKEFAIGISGDIFHLVKELYNFASRTEALQQVCRDFALGGATNTGGVINVLPQVERRFAEPTHIQIKSRPFDTRDFLFWDRVNVDEKILKAYNVKALLAFWLAADAKSPSYPSGLGYSYEITGRYQLYFPYTRNKAKKFRMNWGDDDIPGFYQLTDQRELLIITKSMKDVMCLRSFGYDAVSVKGENVLMDPRFMFWARKEYKRIVILFDNDGKTRAAEYPEEKIWIPKEMPTDKDISDYTDNHSPIGARKLLKSLL
jgi:hypothetical protein